jgi:hypothetical protein
MISKDPETFSSPYQNGKERVTVRLTLPAELMANMRAVSYAVGVLSVEQLIEAQLRIYMFMAPGDIVGNQMEAWEWDDLDEQARLAEAQAIAEDCGIRGQRSEPRSLLSFPRLGAPKSSGD